MLNLRRRASYVVRGELELAVRVYRAEQSPGFSQWRAMRSPLPRCGPRAAVAAKDRQACDRSIASTITGPISAILMGTKICVGCHTAEGAS